jgi:hypothetical protein
MKIMSPHNTDTLASAVGHAAHEAGLAVLAVEHGTSFAGQATVIFHLGLPAGSTHEQRLRLELSGAFDFDKPELLPAMTAHLREETKRLRNPRPNAYVTLNGIPITLSEFQWPFHRSVSGADTYIVHGVLSLADGTDSPLHAKISASMTVTFAEIVPAPEQPYAETFVYNAIRKTLDQGQLELVKSGNRQPVPVTTRYYSRWQKKFFFADTTDDTRRQYLASKVFWLSGILGQSKPVWIADPRDAQYLNTTVDAFSAIASELAGAGLLSLDNGGEFAAATPTLLAEEGDFRLRLNQALAFTKPAFNEEMRAGHTNM